MITGLQKVKFSRPTVSDQETYDQTRNLQTAKSLSITRHVNVFGTRSLRNYHASKCYKRHKQKTSPDRPLINPQD